ncbi:DNA-DIRECTED RNA POLYMERASE III, putative [Babesia bigemina]|uniref:DNA-directed RNA polymerase subunit n=1 Tax=Babesia bigemina TaxID=5866 RepID=A0A061DCI5_BABBI|nr:DNA-DIRECTED RNA POLYMERASE III, putative [Babesia bigemina]CDR96734.1 DNA-DIRECTED RNA POLYMERASE III, putative [Babesia bigemina]|eukprot:XP_012768920.1 DNA-DIRECTED RNA POLYMERASE III, putative [Babesia bigemina]
MLVPNKRQRVASEGAQAAPSAAEVEEPQPFDFMSLCERFQVTEAAAAQPEIVIDEVTPSAATVLSVDEPVGKVLAKKELVKNTVTGCTIEGVQFDVMGSDVISRLAELQIMKRELYDNNTNEPLPLGVLDLKLGSNRGGSLCQTCGKDLKQCVGHWGYIRLQLPVFHIGFFKYTIQILYCICKKCSYLLLPDHLARKFLEAHRRRIDDPLLKPLLFKQILQECRKITKCPRCEAKQGVIRRIVKPVMDQFMKLRHVIKFKEGGKMQTVEEDLNPLVVQQLFEAIDPIHAKILNVVSPEKLLITNLAVPPSCIRPSVTIEAQGTTEDDLTCIFSDIVELNNGWKNQIKNGSQISQFILSWQCLQLQCTRLINADAPAVSQLLVSRNISKPGRGICQRLKGKEGRFRGNLSGKRVDFSARTVISPDPNVGIDEVVVPEWIAMKLTFPEKVTASNIAIMRKAVLNGVSIWPGATYVKKANGGKSSLQYANPKYMSDNLAVGDVVLRHLWDGDVVLFNRQPSLHRMSIMAHRVRVMPGSTFRFNECVCQPYNADFDGDEMNLHLPQTYEAKAEALHLMNVLHNLTTPRNGEPLIAAVQDFLCASYLLTSKDRFLTREQFAQVCCHFTDAEVHVDLPPPAILFPVMLWTGKQVFNALLRPNRSCQVVVNFECKEREFHDPPPGLHSCMCPKDGYVIFHNSELVSGALGKKSLGASKSGLFYQLLTRNNRFIAADCMLRVSKLTSRWLAGFGMTIGLDDVRPGKELLRQKEKLLQDGYTKVSEAIDSFDTLQALPGCTREETLELKVKRVLDELRNEAGKACNSNLRADNKPLIMFNSGAKGALINIAQMVALVGQQNVSGQRIENGFIGRTLPHFDIGCMDAKSRGFVANSFFSGLEPEEFFFHTMSGREGLIDTAVKTSETGYMQRRLMKALEVLSVCYDHTVRTCDGHVVQFLYGDDGLGGASLHMDMTALDMTLKHIRCITRNAIPSDAPHSGVLEILPVSVDHVGDEVLHQVLADGELRRLLPIQLQKKVETLVNWNRNASARSRLVDGSRTQQVLNNLRAFFAVYKVLGQRERNLPLFPEEIVAWVEFLSPMLKEVLPSAIQDHFELSHEGSDDPELRKQYDYNSSIIDTLRKWAASMGIQRSYAEICREFYASCKTPTEFRMDMIKCQHRLSVRQVFEYVRCCWKDYQKAICVPGEAIGALGAQSIGEPGTQMTLKTFHFAGVASMNVTLGVPRIKEIINAANTIQTPIIEVPLLNNRDFGFALAVKARIEKTTLGQVCSNIKEIFAPTGVVLKITLNEPLIKKLLLQIDADKVRDVILDHSIITKFKLGKQCVRVIDKWKLSIELAANQQQFFQQHALIASLLQIMVAGGKNIRRTVIKKESGADGFHYQLAVEGYGLQEVIGAAGVLCTGVKSNHVLEVAKVLGIEAARSVIISEIQKCMDAYSIDIDKRYMKLLGDVMTFRGEVIGINRFGIQKMRASTLMLASFEETNEHLFEAAVHRRRDPIKGVSECIIMGKQVPLGTGAFDLLLKENQVAA